MKDMQFVTLNQATQNFVAEAGQKPILQGIIQIN